MKELDNFLSGININEATEIKEGFDLGGDIMNMKGKIDKLFNNKTKSNNVHDKSHRYILRCRCCGLTDVLSKEEIAKKEYTCPICHVSYVVKLNNNKEIAYKVKNEEDSIKENDPVYYKVHLKRLIDKAEKNGLKVTLVDDRVTFSMSKPSLSPERTSVCITKEV